MAADPSSSVDPLPDMSAHADIPPEDLQVMVQLFQTCPKLWEPFRAVIRVVDLMTIKTQADAELGCNLETIRQAVHNQTEQRDMFIRFISVSGFIEKGVSFARQILRDMGKTYMTDVTVMTADHKVDHGKACLLLIRSNMMSCADRSPECSLRLIRTGYLHDLLEDVKHLQHLSVEALERDGVFDLSLGTILNCTKYPESAAAVRELDIVPHVTPFLTKRGKRYFVQTIAMAVLAGVLVEEGELELLTLEGELLQYSLGIVAEALSSNQDRIDGWSVAELLVYLRLWGRVDANRRLMVAQGTLALLRSVLEPSNQRSEEEKGNAVALISCLIEDQINLQICQNFQELREVLKSLGRSAVSDAKEKVLDVLGKLGHNQGEDLDARLPAFPHVAQLLADQYNLLSILRMGLVQFVLDELKDFTGHQQGRAAGLGEEASGQQVLLAVTELTADHVYGREIMARGGLAMLKTVLQTGSSEDKTEAAKAVLGLTAAPEHRQVIKINSDLTTLLEDAKQRADNPDLAQLAVNILEALHQYTSDVISHSKQ